jgi:transposase-like protein
MMQRDGQVVVNLLANGQQKTIEPLIKGTIVPGTRVYTDEYSIYARLQCWGSGHKRVNHGRGEFARDDDGDACAKCTSTRWKAFGRSCGVGYAHLGGFPKQNAQFI